MKNKNGFTLVEILAAIIILGILLVIAVPTFTNYLKGFREDYYERLEDNVNTSAQTFFADNRSYRPIGLLETTIVKLGTLNNDDYIDDVTDYNGTSCDLESYVIVVKEGKGKYRYETCLKCPNDDYSSDKEYCSDEWLNNDNLNYELGEPPVIYVYQGTPRSELKERLKIKAWITRVDQEGNVIASVNGEDDETGEVPYIYPENIDTVDTNTLGTYPVTYKYGNKEQTGTVIVYKNNAPIIQIETENNGVRKEYDDTDTHDWGQKLHISFTVGDDLFDKADTEVTAIQWRRRTTMKWEDFCVSTDGRSCYRELVTEMNEEVDFRFISNETDYSDIITKTIKIDNTAPKVVIDKTGTRGLDDWYRSDITYKFKQPDTQDLVGEDNDTAAISGIVKWGISTTDPTTDWTREGLFNMSSIDGSNTQTADTHGTTWYLYVEDDAENRTVVSHLAKKDTVPTYVTWDPAADTPHDNNDGITTTGTCHDDDSGNFIDSTYTGTTTQYISSPTPSDGEDVTLTCQDIAGNITTHTGTFYVRYYSQSELCGWNSCLTGENTCSYGCDTCSYCEEVCVLWDDHPESYHCMHAEVRCSNSDCHCSDCYYGHNTCEGGWNSCYHYSN